MLTTAVIFLLGLASFASANPLVKEVAAKDAKAYYRAVDISAAMTTNTFSCFLSNGFGVAFIRVYSSSGTGSVDTNGPGNIRNAVSARLGVEIYMTPNPSGSKPGYTQVDEVYSYLTQQSITVNQIWILVTSPINWPNVQSSNTNFIYSMLQRAQQRNIGVGIYTSSYDWQQITGSWTGWTSVPGVKLWYWHVNGPGTSGMTSQDFTDFSSFSGFNSPSVKQYGQSISLCGYSVNTDVYWATKAAPETQKNEKGVVAVGGWV